MRGGMLPHVVMHKLSEKPYSGYGLCKAIEQSTGHKPSYGSIYPLLEKLASDGEVNVKVQGRKKVYSLTSKGKETLSEMEDRMQELIEQTATRIRILFEITGQDPEPTLSFLKRLKTGEPPLGQVTAKMLKFRDTMFQMATEGKIEKHHEEINKMLSDMQRKLERMK